MVKVDSSRMVNVGAADRKGWKGLGWAARVATLPMHHRDPFDRLLVAQAISEPVRLLTVDAEPAPCSELVTLV